MNINWGKIIPYFIIVALAAILILDVHMHCKSGTGDQVQTSDSAFYWQNKYGDMFASLQKKSIDFGIDEQKYLDSIATLNQTNSKLIQEVISYRVRGKDTITAPGVPEIKYVKDSNQKCPDQVISLTKMFTNPYYNLNVTIDRLGHNSTAIIQTFDTLSSVFKTVREGGFLGIFNVKESLQLDIHSSNPYNKIEGIHAYRVPVPPPKKWGLGIGFGYGYSFVGTQGVKPYPLVFVGIQRNFIRF
jgi:hypothetical protein